jgi:oligopeptidase B
VAKIRAMKTGDHLLLMHTDMEAGHGGASGRYKPLTDKAREYAFLLSLEGIVV